MTCMDWDEKYQKGEVFWDKGGPSLPMRQYLERHAVRGPRSEGGRRALVPGCGRGHEVALAVEHGLDATARRRSCGSTTLRGETTTGSGAFCALV